MRRFNCAMGGSKRIHNYMKCHRRFFDDVSVAPFANGSQMHIKAENEVLCPMLDESSVKQLEVYRGNADKATFTGAALKWGDSCVFM